MITGRPRAIVPIWAKSPYVLVYEGEVIGSVDVSGLDGVFDAIDDDPAHHRRARFPPLYIVPSDEETITWFREWPIEIGQPRDFVIRDNEEDRWYHITRAFVQRQTYSNDSYSVIINGAELGDDPTL